MAGTRRERELPMLAGIVASWHFLEELANIVSVPALTIGTGIALVDLLTGGDLLHQFGWLLFVWGVAQAIGIDTQLPGSMGKARRALIERNYWAMCGYLILGAIIGYIVFIAALVFAMTEAYHIDTADALNRLGFDQFSWLIQRTAISVGVVAVASFTRYHPPVMDVEETEQQRQARMQRELAEAQHKAALGKTKAGGLAGAARAFGKGIMGQETDALEEPNQDDISPDNGANILPFPPGKKDQRNGNSRHKNMLTWVELQQVIKDEYGVILSEEVAKSFIRFQNGGGPLAGSRGGILAAPKAATLRAARAKWGSDSKVDIAD